MRLVTTKLAGVSNQQLVITSRKKGFHAPLVLKQFGPRLMVILVPVQMKMWVSRETTSLNREGDLQL
jgi:hypothetical protein